MSTITNPFAITLTLLGAVLAFLLIAGGTGNAQSASVGDYDIDDDRLIEISNLEQLDAVRYDLNGDSLPDLSTSRTHYSQAFPSAVSGFGCPADGCHGYELTQTLDFNNPSSYASGSVNRGWSRGEGGEGWLPIGIHSDRFGSTFEGNEYTIANLFIDRYTDYVGMFGAINPAGNISRIEVVEADVSGGTRVGPLVGGNGGTIIGSYATGSVSGTRRVGGLVGSNDEGHGTMIGSYTAVSVSGTINVGGLAGVNFGAIINSHATGDVSGDNTVGGLVGTNAGSIGTSYATGNVSGNRTVGGLVGKNSSRGAIIWSYATGNVSGVVNRTGGLAGENSNAIRGSYATGSVTGDSRTGGLVGANFSRGTIISSYAIGAVTGGSSVGGLVGYNDDRCVVIGSYAAGSVSGTGHVGGLTGWNARSNGILVSYWDTESSGQSQGVGGGFTSGAAGKTTAELQAQNSYAGIYRDWNTDIDDADGDSYDVTGPDDPWDFGMDDQYPTLREYFDRDGGSTWDIPVDEGEQFSIEARLLADDNTLLTVSDSTLMILEIGDAVSGTVSLDGSTIIYSHDGSETTNDSFIYTAIDGIRVSVVTVAISVTPVNDPPVGVRDTATVDEGGTLSVETTALLDNDIDGENDTLTIVTVRDAVNGWVSLVGTTITYDHDGSEKAGSSFSYTVSDGTDADSTTVAITVLPVNDPPVAVGDTVTVDEGDTLTMEATELLDNDTDVENETLTIVAVGDAVNGRVSMDGSTIIYEHDGSEANRGGFTYTLSDGALSDMGAVSVAVTPVNDPPVAVADTLALDEGDTVSLDLFALLRNDIDPDSNNLNVTGVAEAINGRVWLEGMTIIYEHDGSETTTGSFIYSITDGLAIDTTEVVVKVTPVNDPPIAFGDTVSVTKGATLSMVASVLLDNDTDAENDTLNIVAVGDPVNGMVFLEGATVTYEHDGSETVEGSFSYTVSDGTDTDSTTVVVTVMPGGDDPEAADEGTAVNTATPEVEATVSPIAGSDDTPATSPPTTPEASVPTTDNGGMNVGLIILIIFVVMAFASIGTVVVMRRRNRT